MHLFYRPINLVILELVLSAILLLVGVPATWVTIASLLAIDLAVIARLGQDSSPRGGKRALKAPLWALSVLGA